MHIVFAGSALVMTIATLWMMAKDHNREWKDWQLKNRSKEAWITQARHDELAGQYATRMDRYEAEIRRVQSQPIDGALIDQFKAIVAVEDARLVTAEINEKKAEFGKLEAAIADFGEAAKGVVAAQEKIGQAGDSPESDLQRALAAAERRAIDARSEVDWQLERFIAEAHRREKQLVVGRKFVAADRTAAVSELGLKIAGGASDQEGEAVQHRIDGFTEKITDLTARIADAQNYRTDLEAIRDQIDAQRATIAKEIGTLTTELSRLEDQVSKNTSNPLEWVIRWPILNALYDGNVRIDQIWLPDLTINFNFSHVARFDRCKSCHQAISQTSAGSATEAAYPTIPGEQRQRVIALPTPDEAPSESDTLTDVYGLILAEEGIVDYSDVTVYFVLPESPAAKAGLESGDIIRLAGDRPAYEPATVTNYLLSGASWGEPASLTIVRGLDHPFTSHPRLDLYLTDSSPHPEKIVGCTICHDGQGSGTEFPWTSHTPDNAEQQNKWAREHGWFDNHHWIFPMKPSRFTESNCLKCHHDKGSLEPSERFPEPPAAKLVEGWSLVEKYGCFGCHEIGGFDGPSKRIGPDLRLEPGYSAVAAQLLNDPSLSGEQQRWARSLVGRPDDSESRHRLFVSLKQDAKLAASSETRADAKLASTSHKLAAELKDVEVAGAYRKAGPSLRFLDSKVEFDWLYRWIEKPANFRPTTRMPQFFGQYEHLLGDPDELAVSERFEPVEIRAVTEFLLAASSDFEYLRSPEEITESPSAERGKWLFESRGCLACHSHKSFTGIAADQGPDLSRVGAKFRSEKGARWLYSWIKQPHRYHVRTKMPELFLDPLTEKDATGKPTGKITDPAADIAAFLMGTPTDWQPASSPGREWSAEEQEALADLAQEWLTSDAIPAARAGKFVREGIPAHLEPKLKADEKLLLAGVMNNQTRVKQLQTYVARRTISKYGCFGCHDIPGFEDSKPIGTSLAEWGRKETSKLAFENIHKFLEGPGNPNNNGDGAHGAAGAHAAHGHLDPSDFDPDTSYYIQSLNSHSRDGFIWQKLRMPRSYDYKTTKNKGYNERLRMPKFPFTEAEREAVITFVLGLVNEAPADKFVYKPDTRQQAIVEGRQVLEKFNCAGCHTLSMEQWQLAFEEGDFDSPSTISDYPFLATRFSEKEIAESKVKDLRGRFHATLYGQPMMNQETGLAERVDEDGLPIEPDDDESEPYYLFKLWRNAVINGQTWPVGVQDIMVRASNDYGPAEGQAYPAEGGDLARYLFPQVIAKAKEINPQVKGSEAWGWLPPPLMNEGEKVQTDWLHGFLMDPTSIRPAVVMRMPNFHMSSDDAAKLVNYFAATSGVQFPYEYRSHQRASYLAEMEADRPERLNEAMNIVVNGNYCVKCHAVEDFQPEGDPATFGPNLANVHDRLRPEFLRNWIANPKRGLPYTGMPVNIPYKPGEPGISEKIFRGTSIEQLDGLADLLMNFDTYAKRQTSITPLVKASAKNAPQASKTDQ